MPGKTLPVTLKIRNAGSESVSQIGYKVTMQSADQTEKVLVEEEKDVTITAGETVPVVVNVPIQENISSRKLKLQIWEMKGGAVVGEVSDNNNFSEITVGLTDLEISEISAKCYTGAEIRPEFTVTYQGAALSQSTDYTVTWRNNVKVGTATAVLTGIGDYFGMKEITFVIENHKWDGSMKTVQEATALAYGSQERTCTRCGKKETNQRAKLRPTMSVNASSIVLRRGQSTTKLKVTGLAKGDRIASWTSSNKKIVNVNSSGKIKAAKKDGKATITITLRSGYKKKISVKVQKTAVKTTKIQGIQKKLTIRRKKSYTLVPGILPITSLEKVTFTSSNKKVATVTAKGKVTAKKKGTAVITVKAGRIRKRCKITVR